VTPSATAAAPAASRGSRSPRSGDRTQHSAATVSTANRRNPGTASCTPQPRALHINCFQLNISIYVVSNQHHSGAFNAERLKLRAETTY